MNCRSISELPDELLELIVIKLKNRDVISFISTNWFFRNFSKRTTHLFVGRTFYLNKVSTPGVLFQCSVVSLKVNFSLFSKMRPNDAIRSICNFNKLSSLSVKLNSHGMRFFDDLNLSCIGRLTTLRSLVLSSFCNKSLDFLSTLESLQVLNISNGEWRDLSSLRHLTCLEYLNINHCRSITNFDSLSNCIMLKNLKARSTLVSNTYIFSLLINLASIDLRETSISDTSGLSNLPNLSAIRLSNKFFPAGQFFPILNGGSIRHLNLKHCDSIQCSREVFRNFINLCFLDLSYCSLESLDFIGKDILQSLETLRLDFNFFNDPGPLAFLPCLKFLSIRGGFLHDASVFSRCPALAQLDLRESKIIANFLTIGLSKTIRQLNMSFARLDFDMLCGYVDSIRTSRAPVELIEVTGTSSSYELPLLNTNAMLPFGIVFENSSCFLRRII
jgi:hypothetical protein